MENKSKVVWPTPEVEGTQERRLARGQAVSYLDDRGKFVTKTKQSFKDSADINKMIKQFERTGVPAPGAEAKFADVSSVPDFQDAHQAVINGRALFLELPADIRFRFRDDIASFVEFVSNPANAEELVEMFGEKKAELDDVVEPAKAAPAAVKEEPVTPEASAEPSEGGS